MFKKIKKQFNFVRKLKLSSSKDADKKARREQLIVDAHRQYMELVQACVNRTQETLAILKQMGIGSVARMVTIEHYIAHAERQIDQIRRRVIDGETIAHHEKVFSIFEEHTEWPSKSKPAYPRNSAFLAVCWKTSTDLSCTTR